MPDLLTKIYEPTPGKFTPEQELGYQQWRAQQLANWTRVFTKMQSGPLNSPLSDAQRQKQAFVLQHYNTDSNSLRQEYLNQAQKPSPPPTATTEAVKQ